MKARTVERWIRSGMYEPNRSCVRFPMNGFSLSVTDNASQVTCPKCSEARAELADETVR